MQLVTIRRTYKGVLDGLKRGRKIYVRYASAEEKNANGLLISAGATAVDMEGNEVDVEEAMRQEKARKKEAVLSQLQNRQLTLKDLAKALGVPERGEAFKAFKKSVEGYEEVCIEKNGRDEVCSLRKDRLF